LIVSVVVMVVDGVILIIVIVDLVINVVVLVVDEVVLVAVAVAVMVGAVVAAVSDVVRNEMEISTSHMNRLVLSSIPESYRSQVR